MAGCRNDDDRTYRKRVQRGIRSDLCEALLSIREEIRSIEKGEVDLTDNVIKMAPHTISGSYRFRLDSSIFKRKGGVPS